MSKRFFSFRVIIGSFALAILCGTILLMLPVSKAGAGHAGFADAFFTATSAVCVTGLVVHNTSTYWSLFGQLVILGMIQVGGMGVMTVMIAIITFSRRKIGLVQRSTIQDAIAAPQVGGIIRMTRFILKFTLCVEFAGALLMAPVFCRIEGLPRGLWQSLFHSVSAFCNAGFDLTGHRTPFSSLTAFSAFPLINIVIMLLIMFGGIGFLTWEDLRANKFHFKKYRLQSKIVLVTSAVLIVLPAVFFYFYEFSYMRGGTRIFASLFQSITTRTAGFNTVSIDKISNSSKAIMILLMLVGGSPGSTAGGLKTTTLAVLIVTALSVVRGKSDAQCFGRRIEFDAVKNAVTLLMLYIFLFLFGGIFISCFDALPLSDCFFEAASAIGTVGLTTGITPTLSMASRAVLTALMFLGRVGGLTLVFAATSSGKAPTSKLPQEKISVG